MDKKVLYDLSYGMYAIGAMDDNRDCGCIVNTVFQITSQDPLIAISMNKDNYTYELIKKNKQFSVSILSEKTNPEVISRLGFVSGKDHDKWQNFDYKKWHNLPVVNDHVLGYMFCEVETMVETSTHYVILAKVSDAVKETNGNAMTYSYYHNVIKGKAPKKAPTYQEEPVTNKEQWVCTVCGYVYDGEDFEKESDSYVCPICGVPKYMFEKR